MERERENVPFCPSFASNCFTVNVSFFPSLSLSPPPLPFPPPITPSPGLFIPDNNNIWPRVTKPIRSHIITGIEHPSTPHPHPPPPSRAAGMVQSAESEKDGEHKGSSAHTVRLGGR